MAVAFAPDPAHCKVHNLPMLSTQSGLQQACQKLDCDEHVRLDGPHEEPQMVKQDLSKEDRAKMIQDAAAKKAAEGKLKVTIPPPKPKKVKPAPPEEGADDELVKPKKEKKEKDPNMLSISDIARACGIDPKVARGKLRKDGARAPEGRWTLVKKDSKEHKKLVELFTPDAESDDVEEETEEEGEE